MKKSVLKIVTKAVKQGWRVLLVGGYVRDSLLGLESKDIDLEFYGPGAEELETFLAAFGKVNKVGKSFGVMKLKIGDDEFDVSIPRRENKTGRGHKGFQVEFDPSLSPKEAAERRDFTVNSLMMDPLTEEIIDNFNGRADLKNKILRASNPKYFIEDPLRVLRAFQFAGRFEMAVDNATIELCRSIKNEYPTITSERIWIEWEKWALKSQKPSLGLHFLKQCEWWDFYPELKILDETPQDPKFHPEGNVWVHTCHCVDVAVKIAEKGNLNRDDRIILMFATLLHDFGKPETTYKDPEDGIIKSGGHPQVAEEPGFRFLEKIGVPKTYHNHIINLCKEHMFLSDPTERAIRRLAKRLEPSNIKMLTHVAEADNSGRPPMPKGLPENFKNLMQIAEEIEVKNAAPKPLISGKILIHEFDLPKKPTPMLGVITDLAYEAQLDGAFENYGAGLEWLRLQPRPFFDIAELIPKGKNTKSILQEVYNSQLAGEVNTRDEAIELISELTDCKNES